MAGARLLITGAGGFVGAAVAKAAVDAGHDVIAVVRNNTGRLRNIASQATIVRADFSDPRAVDTLVRSARPEVVIHSAWEGVGGALRSSEVQFDNIRTTVSLADAAISAGARKFVGIGSQAEYGRYDRRIFESDLPQPTMLYGAAKLATFHLVGQRCRESGVDFAWLRLFSVFGPGDNSNWLIPSTAASLLRRQMPRCTAGTQKWDYLYIDDVARGVLAATTSPGAVGLFNLSSGSPVAVRAIVERLRDIAAPGLELQFGQIPFARDQIMHLEGDNSRLRDATDWSVQVPVMDGLARFLDSLRAAA